MYEAPKNNNTTLVLVSKHSVLVVDPNVNYEQPKPEMYFKVNGVSCGALCFDVKNKKIATQMKIARERNVMCMFVLDPFHLQQEELQTWSKAFEMYILSVQMEKPLDVLNFKKPSAGSSCIVDSKGSLLGKTSKKGSFVTCTARAGKVVQSKEDPNEILLPLKATTTNETTGKKLKSNLANPAQATVKIVPIGSAGNGVAKLDSKTKNTPQKSMKVTPVESTSVDQSSESLAEQRIARSKSRRSRPKMSVGSDAMVHI